MTAPTIINSSIMKQFWVITIGCVIFGKASVGQTVDLGLPENFAIRADAADYHTEGARNVNDKGESFWNPSTHSSSGPIAGRSNKDVTSDSDCNKKSLQPVPTDMLAVPVQSSLATKNQAQFSTDLTTIRDARKDTFDGFSKIVNGYSSILQLLVKDSSEKQEYDEETIDAINNITTKQIAACIQAYDTTMDGVKPIAGNVTVITSNEDEAHAELEAWIKLVSTVFTKFPSTNYSKTLAAIEDIEKVAIPAIGDFWIQLYDLIMEAINSHSLEINNLLQTIARPATYATRNAFSSVFAALKILLIQLSDETQAQREACSFVIETQKSLALSLFSCEIHTKFTLHQYIATSLFINDAKIITDLNKIQTANEAILTGFQYALEPIFAALIQLTEKRDISSSIEALRITLSSGLDLAIVNTIVSLSYIQPECSATVAIEKAEQFAKVDVLVEGIIAAVQSTQGTNSSEALAEIEAIAETVVTTAVHMFGDLWAAMEAMASNIDDKVVVAIESYSKKSSVLVESAMRHMFAAIKILVPQDTYKTDQAGCSADVILIKTAHTAVLSDLNSVVWLKFDFIRAFRLLGTLKAHGISSDLSSLLYESY